MRFKRPRRRKWIPFKMPPDKFRKVRGTDDYLTARAANPRTGLVSPSIYTATPFVPGPSNLDGTASSEASAPAPNSHSTCSSSDEGPLRTRLNRLLSRPTNSLQRRDASVDVRREGSLLEQKKRSRLTRYLENTPRHEHWPTYSEVTKAPQLRSNAEPSTNNSIKKPDEVLLAFNVPSPIPTPPPLPIMLDGAQDTARAQTLPLLKNRNLNRRGERRTDPGYVVGRNQVRNLSLPVLAASLHLDEAQGNATANLGRKITRKPVPSSTNTFEVHDPADERWPGLQSFPSVRLKNLCDRLPKLNLRHPSEAAKPRAGQITLRQDTLRRRALLRSASSRSSTSARTIEVQVKFLRTLTRVAWFFIKQVGSASPIREAVGLWRSFSDESLSPEERLAALRALLRYLGSGFMFCTAVACIWSVVTIVKCFLDVALKPFWIAIRILGWLRR